jgi:hypothetical protein
MISSGMVKQNKSWFSVELPDEDERKFNGFGQLIKYIKENRTTIMDIVEKEGLLQLVR